MDSFEGQLLAGKYRVERVLGRGGMGVVVAAMHRDLDQRVALKFLVPSALENEEAVGRFVREARSAVRLTSEHVARVIDVGTLENGAPFIVMEYLDGCDLAGVVAARGPLPVADAVDYVLQACEALAEAHASGIVHRDLKPANLFLIRRRDGTECVKVLDFGIAKISGKGTDPGLTQPTSGLGTPSYMSPEQMRSAKNADVRSDIWSIGIILHELLTGELAFAQETLPELCTAILNDPPPPLGERRPDVPERLANVVLTCLAKEPSERYQDVGELAAALSEFAGPEARTSVERARRILGVQSSQPFPGVPSSDQPTLLDPGAAPSDPVESSELTLPERKLGKWMVAAALMAALAAGALWVFSPGPPSAEPREPVPAAKIVVAAPVAAVPPPVESVSVAAAVSASAPLPVPARPKRVPPRRRTLPTVRPVATASPPTRSFGEIPGEYGDRK